MTISNWRFLRSALIRGWNKRVRAKGKKGEPLSKTLDALLIKPKDSQVNALTKIQIFQAIYGDIASPVMPEWWPIRVGADRPQLVVVFRSDDKVKSQFQITIPHYSGSKNPKIPDFRKGSHFARYVLKDNSKLIVYAASESEAVRMAEQMYRYVSSRYRAENPRPTTGVTRSNRFKEVKAVPIFADYYPDGQRGAREWRAYL